MKKQGFLYGSAVLMISALLVKITGAMFKIPLAHMLGGTGMGYFSTAYSIFMPVYAVSVTGLPAAAARSVSAAVASGRADKAEAVKKTALMIFGGIGLAGAGIIMLGAYPFCLFTSGDILALPAVIAIAPSVPAGCLISVYRGYYEGQRNMYPTAVSQITEGLAKLIFGLTLCGGCMNLSEKDPELFSHIFGCSADNITPETAVPYAAASAVFGITLSSFAGLAYMILHDRKNSKKRTAVRISRGEKSRIGRELMRIAVPAALGALVTNLTSLIDLVTIMRSLKKLVKTSPWVFSELLGAGIGYGDIPNFIYGSFTGLAVTLFNLVPSFTNMFGKSMLPAAAAAKEEGNADRLGECTFGVLLASALISIPAGLGICVLSEEILTALFSGRTAEIAASAGAMSVLGLAVPFVCISSAAFSVFQAADRADIPVKLMGIGAAVKFIGNIILTPMPRLGVTGAAAATLLCYAVICVISVIMLKKGDFLKNHENFGWIFKIIFCSCLCAAGAAAVYGQLFGLTNIAIKVLLSCFSGVIIYIISTYFTGIITKSTLKMLISYKNSKTHLNYLDLSVNILNGGIYKPRSNAEGVRNGFQDQEQV
ncbi:MAG: polysaccharide biosynthesis C-terminal domain-containing protein [Ruminococcus sp.]|nr:polysaccharide biosynthesis C-terminal domain-containing protein [Ruminococcus sp.]